ncbi:dipeptidase [Oceanibacterium hippocampi]|uniref:Membrane dipeptidase (Peptidase family M19) n=1 Tax=Oceanibacterium hippocampi TaxID=745714 RepID=A0A1Y5TRE4_9PROT|nr:membrane dipeptidase [Oceanibacterium hippocampi]SLN70140.1 Membrane dipeptidase (Peptidase family M19) [Oceanibacterium hippocampi]
MTRKDVSDAAAALHGDALFWDMTMPWRMPGDPALRAALPGQLVEGGYDAVSITVATDDDDSASALAGIAEARHAFGRDPERFRLIDGVDDILAAKAGGQIAVGLHFQGSRPVGRDLRLVEAFYKLGIRHMLMAYNQKNFVGDGCHELTDGGLSGFGRELIAEMNRVGMMVDIAHTGLASSLEAVERSTAPVIISHSNAWALRQHPRCVRDEQIRAVAATGGVVGITGLGIFLAENDASPTRFVDHVDHAVNLVGVEHVGIGFDYMYDLPYLTELVVNSGGKWPKEWGYTTPDIEQIRPWRAVEVTQALLDRGYAEADVRAILGGNWLRVAKAVWR